jgi:EAL domain-containing protein (putative c-di-GMP-specific phosphodiesterase class I)
MLDKIIGVSIDIRRYFESTDVEQADVILKNRIEMIRQLGKTVIINGIDSEKYFVMLKEQPVDLMFGDYLSRRVDKHELAQLAGHKALTPSEE